MSWLTEQSQVMIEVWGMIRHVVDLESFSFYVNVPLFLSIHVHEPGNQFRSWCLIVAGLGCILVHPVELSEEPTDQP